MVAQGALLFQVGVHCELEADGHQITMDLSADEAVMQAAVDGFQPDLILCPFLKHRVPAAIWREHGCLIVHSGIEGDRSASSLDWAIHLERKAWGVTLLQLATFGDPNSDYHQLRYNFVHKISCGKTPARLVCKAPQERLLQMA